MANLESDIIGRVNRLALRPSEKNALLPLMEAVSNSVHSITDLYETDAAAKGRISVRIYREDEMRIPTISPPDSDLMAPPDSGMISPPFGGVSVACFLCG